MTTKGRGQTCQMCPNEARPGSDYCSERCFLRGEGFVPEGRSTTAGDPDVWRGHKARVTPSGHIHLVEWVSHRDTFERDVATMACGKEERRSNLTIHFPSEGRHCPRCFPPSDGASETAAILADSDAMTAIRDGDLDVIEGQVTDVEYLGWPSDDAR